jgi:hypothetical protein
MRKIGLVLLFAGLLLIGGAGCGGGGGGGGGDDNPVTPTFNPKVVGTHKINLSSKITNDDNDVIKLTITSIKVESDKTLNVNCAWTVYKNNSGKTISKVGDVDKYCFYLYDNAGKKYYNTGGTGAAYTTTELSSTAVTGVYYFSALNSGITSIYFYDNDYDNNTDYDQTIGPILISDDI